MAEATIDPKWAAKQQKAFGKDRANRIARNSVTSMDVMAAARDVTALRSARFSWPSICAEFLEQAVSPIASLGTSPHFLTMFMAKG